MSNKKLSIILLSYFSGKRIVDSYNKLSTILKSNNIPYEFIIIDDGSTDDSFNIAEDLERESTDVRAFQLTRNYTSHYAIFAGLTQCQGGCAIPIPDDEQLPYHSIVEMYNLWLSGEKVIIPFRNKRGDPWPKSQTSELFYRIMNNLSDVKYPPGGADSFLIDREIIDIINNDVHPINTATITEVLRIGFDPYHYPYDRPLGINGRKSRWSFKKKFKLAKDTFFSSSSYPIKFITSFGMITSILAFVTSIFYGYIKLFGNDEFWNIEVPGWTSIIVIVTFFSGLIILSLGIIAEYIWRIYEEVKARPGFIIKQKRKQD